MQKKYKFVMVGVLCCAFIFNVPYVAHATLADSGLVRIWKHKILFGGGIEYFSSYVFRRTEESKRVIGPRGVKPKSKNAAPQPLSQMEQQFQSYRLMATSA